MYGGRNWWRILFFIPHLMYFILSFIYLIKSCNKNTISNHIYLRSFSLYNFFSSFISLLFILVLLIHSLGFNDGRDGFDERYLVILLFAFFGFLLAIILAIGSPTPPTPKTITILLEKLVTSSSNQLAKEGPFKL